MTSIDDDFVQCLATIEADVRAWGAQAEIDRDLPRALVEALREAGWFRIWAPQALGGLELHPVHAVRLFESLARVDSAAGWVVANAAVITTFCQVLADGAVEEVFARPDTIVAGGWFPPGTAIDVDGGFRVTGRWAFGSACRHADWMTGMVVLLDPHGAPRLTEQGGPDLALVFVPAREAEVVPNWDTLGMRGTGSHDVRVDDVFVPARRTFAVRPWDRPARAFGGPLYRFHMWLGGAEIAAVALGVAQAAVDDFVSFAQAKVPSYTEQPMAARGVVQDHLARATALVAAGRAYLHATLDAAFEGFVAGAEPGPATLTPVQLAACHAVDSAVRAVDLLHGLAGTSGIRTGHPLERHFRDVHTIAQHALSSAARYESVGQLLFGQQSSWSFFYL